MHVSNHRASGFWARLVGLPALVLALACQLALGAADLPDQAADALSLQTTGVMCRSHAASDHAPPHRHAAVPAFCSFASAFGHVGVMPASCVDVPAPAIIATWAGTLPPARAPPALPRSTAYPRGPPLI
jgi:hypothetical protein